MEGQIGFHKQRWIPTVTSERPYRMDLAGFFLLFFSSSSLRVLHVYQRCGYLHFFAGLITWALFFLFCLSNGYRARR
jgi:hypothetical protein